MNQPHAFVFTGFSGKLKGYPEWMFRKILERQGYVVHTFTDHDFDMYITGGEQFETGEAMRQYLREYVDTGAECLALASSGGGFGGIMHSNAVGIQCVVAYSAFTTIDLEARQYDKRGQSILGMLDQLIEDDEKRNLRYHLEHDGLKSNIHLFFADGHRRDTFQARNLEEFETVTLHRMVGKSHTMSDVETNAFEMLAHVAELENLHFRWPE